MGQNYKIKLNVQYTSEVVVSDIFFKANGLEDEFNKMVNSKSISADELSDEMLGALLNLCHEEDREDFVCEVDSKVLKEYND